MKTPFRTVAGGGFDAGVLPPGPLEREDRVRGRELADDYITSLTSTVMYSRNLLTDEEREEINQLVMARMMVNRRIKELLEAIADRARAQIIEELEAAKAAVREQEQRITEHREEIAALTRELNRRNELRAQAFAARDQAQAEQRQCPNCRIRLPPGVSLIRNPSEGHVPGAADWPLQGCSVYGRRVLDSGLRT